jgi:hypothetical protein
MDTATGERIINLRSRIVEGFTQNHWEELGLLLGESACIVGHPRLLRSLSFQDDDYAGNVLTVIRQMVTRNPRNLQVIEDYVAKQFQGDSAYVSAKPADKRITFAPNVFQVPDAGVESDLVAVMMPFSMEFRAVFDAIGVAATSCNMRCLRADDIWEHETIIQDIFSLIFRAQIVVVDFTGKNPNVMYETGIAHTLGKHVVPITQNIDDVPFDIRHHRVLRYLANAEGLGTLTRELNKKFRQIGLGGTGSGTIEWENLR